MESSRQEAGNPRSRAACAPSPAAHRTHGNVRSALISLTRCALWQWPAAAAPPSRIWRKRGKLRPSVDVGVFPHMSANQGGGASTLLFADGSYVNRRWTLGLGWGREGGDRRVGRGGV